jgi:hypothetical protein
MSLVWAMVCQLGHEPPPPPIQQCPRTVCSPAVAVKNKSIAAEAQGENSSHVSYNWWAGEAAERDTHIHTMYTGTEGQRRGRGAEGWELTERETRDTGGHTHKDERGTKTRAPPAASRGG